MADKTSKKRERDGDVDTDIDLHEFDDLSLDDPVGDGTSHGSGRKPSTPLKKALIAGMKGVGGGVASGIKGEIYKAVPTLEVINSDIATAYGEFKDLKNDLSSQLGPMLITLEDSTRKVLPRAKKLLPKKLYEKVDKKLKERAETRAASTYDAPSKEQVERETIHDELATIFSEQQQLAQVQALEQKKAELTSMALEGARHKQNVAQLSHVYDAVRGTEMFHRTIHTAYLKKSLELKYKHLFVAKDTFNLLSKSMATFESYFQAITRNTALPDMMKVEVGDIGKKRRTDKYGTMMADLMGKAREKIFEKIKTKAKNAVQTFGMFTDQIGMAADMSSMMDDMPGVEAPTAGSMLANLIGKGIGHLGMGSIAKKYLGKIKPMTDNIDDTLKNAKAGATLKVANLGRNWAQSDNRLLHFLSEFLPQINPHATGGNALVTDADKPAVFDTMTRQSIVEIIPGYLAKILNSMEKVRTGNENLEEQIYNVYDRRFTSVSELKAGMEDKLYGSEATRRENFAKALGSLQANVGATGSAKDASGADVDPKEYYRAYRKDINRVLVNHAVFAEFLDFKAIGDFVAAGGSKPPTPYISRIIAGLDHEPIEVLQALYRGVVDKDGKLDRHVVNDINSVINNYRMTDSYKAEMPKLFETYGYREHFADKIGTEEKKQLMAAAKAGDAAAKKKLKDSLGLIGDANDINLRGIASTQANVDFGALDKDIDYEQANAKTRYEDLAEGDRQMREFVERTGVNRAADWVSSKKRAWDNRKKDADLFGPGMKWIHQAQEAINKKISAGTDFVETLVKDPNARADFAAQLRRAGQEALKDAKEAGLDFIALSQEVMDDPKAAYEKLKQMGAIKADEIAATLNKHASRVSEEALNKLKELKEKATNLYEEKTPQSVKDAINAVGQLAKEAPDKAEILLARLEKAYDDHVPEDVKAKIAEVRTTTEQKATELKDKAAEAIEEAAKSMPKSKEEVIDLASKAAEVAKKKATEVADTVKTKAPEILDTGKKKVEKTVAKAKEILPTSTEELKEFRDAISSSVAAAVAEAMKKMKSEEPSLPPGVTLNAATPPPAGPTPPPPPPEFVPPSPAPVSGDSADIIRQFMEKYQELGGNTYTLLEGWRGEVKENQDAIFSGVANINKILRELPPAIQSGQPMSEGSDGGDDDASISKMHNYYEKYGVMTRMERMGKAAGKGLMNMTRGVGKVYSNVYGAALKGAGTAAKGLANLAGKGVEAAGKIGKSVADRLPETLSVIGGGLKNIGKGYLSVYNTTIKTAGKAVGGVASALFGKKADPYEDIYRKDEIGGRYKPILTRLQQERDPGVFFKDGKRVKMSSDIHEPVYDVEGKPLISQEDIDHGLVGGDGKPLTKKAGSEGLIGKVLDIGKALAPGVGKGIKNIAGLYKDVYSKLFGFALDGAKGLGKMAGNFVNRLFGFDVGGTSKKLIDLVTLIQQDVDLLAQGKKKGGSVGDKDGDGDVDGSYADQMQNKEKKEYGKLDAVAEHRDVNWRKKPEEGGGGKGNGEDGEGGGLKMPEWAKKWLGNQKWIKNNKWLRHGGRRFKALGKVLGGKSRKMAGTAGKWLLGRGKALVPMLGTAGHAIAGGLGTAGSAIAGGLGSAGSAIAGGLGSAGSALGGLFGLGGTAAGAGTAAAGTAAAGAGAAGGAGLLGTLGAVAGPAALAALAGYGIYRGVKGFNKKNALENIGQSEGISKENQLTGEDRMYSALGMNSKIGAKTVKFISKGLGIHGLIKGIRGNDNPLTDKEIEQGRSKLQRKVDKKLPGYDRILQEYEKAVEAGNWRRARELSSQEADGFIKSMWKNSYVGMAASGIGNFLFGNKDETMSEGEIKKVHDKFQSIIKKGGSAGKNAEKLLSKFDDYVAEGDWKNARKIAGMEKQGLFGKLFKDSKGNVSWSKVIGAAAGVALGPLGLLAGYGVGSLFTKKDPNQPMTEEEVKRERERLQKLAKTGNKQAEKLLDQFDEAVTEMNWKKARKLVGKEVISNLAKFGKGVASTMKWTARIGTLGLSMLFENDKNTPMSEAEIKKFTDKMNFLISKHNDKLAAKKLERFEEAVAKENWEKARQIAKMEHKSLISRGIKSVASFFFGDNEKEMTEAEMNKFRESMQRKIKMGSKTAQKKLDAFEDAVGAQRWPRARAIAQAPDDGLVKSTGKAIGKAVAGTWRFLFGGDGASMSDAEIKKARTRMERAVTENKKGAQKRLDLFNDYVADEKWEKARHLAKMPYENIAKRTVKALSGALFGDDSNELTPEEINKFQKECEQRIADGNPKAEKILEKFNSAVEAQDWEKARQISGIKDFGMVGAVGKAIGKTWDWLVGNSNYEDCQKIKEELEEKAMDDESGVIEKGLEDFEKLVRRQRYNDAMDMAKDLLKMKPNEAADKYKLGTDKLAEYKKTAEELDKRIGKKIDADKSWFSLSRMRLKSLRNDLKNPGDWCDEFFEDIRDRFASITGEDEYTDIDKPDDSTVKEGEKLIKDVEASQAKFGWLTSPIKRTRLACLKSEIQSDMTAWCEESFDNWKKTLKDIDKDYTGATKKDDYEKGSGTRPGDDQDPLEVKDESPFKAEEGDHLQTALEKATGRSFDGSAVKNEKTDQYGVKTKRWVDDRGEHTEKDYTELIDKNTDLKDQVQQANAKVDAAANERKNALNNARDSEREKTIGALEDARQEELKKALTEEERAKVNAKYDSKRKEAEAKIQAKYDKQVKAIDEQAQISKASNAMDMSEKFLNKKKSQEDAAAGRQQALTDAGIKDENEYKAKMKRLSELEQKNLEAGSNGATLSTKEATELSELRKLKKTVSDKETEYTAQQSKNRAKAEEGENKEFFQKAKTDWDSGADKRAAAAKKKAETDGPKSFEGKFTEAVKNAVTAPARMARALTESGPKGPTYNAERLKELEQKKTEAMNGGKALSSEEETELLELTRAKNNGATALGKTDPLRNSDGDKVSKSVLDYYGAKRLEKEPWLKDVDFPGDPDEEREAKAAFMKKHPEWMDPTQVRFDAFDTDNVSAASAESVAESRPDTSKGDFKKGFSMSSDRPGKVTVYDKHGDSVTISPDKLTRDEAREMTSAYRKEKQSNVIAETGQNEINRRDQISGSGDGHSARTRFERDLFRANQQKAKEAERAAVDKDQGKPPEKGTDKPQNAETSKQVSDGPSPSTSDTGQTKTEMAEKPASSPETHTRRNPMAESTDNKDTKTFARGGYTKKFAGGGFSVDNDLSGFASKETSSMDADGNPIVYGEAGTEAILPLNNRPGNLLNMLGKKISASLNGENIGPSSNTTTDKASVHASDPAAEPLTNHLANQLADSIRSNSGYTKRFADGGYARSNKSEVAKYEQLCDDLDNDKDMSAEDTYRAMYYRFAAEGKPFEKPTMDDVFSAYGNRDKKNFLKLLNLCRHAYNVGTWAFAHYDEAFGETEEASGFSLWDHIKGAGAGLAKTVASPVTGLYKAGKTAITGEVDRDEYDKDDETVTEAIFSAPGKAINNTFSWIGKGANSTGGAVADGSKAVGNALADGADAVGSGISTAASKTLSGAKRLGDVAGDVLVTGASAVGTGLSAGLDTLHRISSRPVGTGVTMARNELLRPNVPPVTEAIKDRYQRFSERGRPVQSTPTVGSFSKPKSGAADVGWSGPVMQGRLAKVNSSAASTKELATQQNEQTRKTDELIASMNRLVELFSQVAGQNGLKVDGMGDLITASIEGASAAANAGKSGCSNDGRQPMIISPSSQALDIDFGINLRKVQQ